MRNNKIVLISITIISFLFIFYNSADAKFINLFINRNSGDPLRTGDEVKLAKFDIILAQKAHYNDIGGNTWGAIKAINPQAEIYLYIMTTSLGPDLDSVATVNIATFGRYNISRGHSMGSVNRNHPEFFLLDSNNQRVEWTWPGSVMYRLDFGDSNFQRYAVEALVTDYVDQPWTADGVFSDYIHAIQSGAKTTPVKYNTDAKWSTAMNRFANALTVGLAAQGQKFACSRGLTTGSSGANAWLALDSSANPPDAVQEEGAFAVSWGNGDIQFYREHVWKRQIDLLSALKNSKVLFKSSTDLAPGQSGIDFDGKSFNFWDALWYTLGSYLVGKNDIENNSYFSFQWKSSNMDYFYNEYDKIDLGNAISSYKIANINGHNIYWREFDDGYVYVNPTLNNVTSIPLPEPCKQRTHNNLNLDIDSLPDKNSISLNSHRAAILYKSYQSSPPPPSQPPPPSTPPPSGAGGIIVDTGDAGTSSTGTWRRSIGPNYYGNQSLFSNQAGATYTYQTAINGNYDVSLWWTVTGNRDTSVPVRIYSGNTLLDTVWIDQLQDGGQWNHLGTYNFGGTAKIVIAHETGSDISTCADAAMFTPLGAPPPPPPPPSGGIILDNGDAGTSSTGAWSFSIGPNYYGNKSLFSNQAGATYTYQTAINGNSDVSLWWTQRGDRDNSVPVRIYSGNTLLETVWIDQQQDGGKWNYLGTYNFAGTAKVVITSETGGSSTCADAAMFTPLGAPPPPPQGEIILDNGDAGTSSTGTWSRSIGPNYYGNQSLFSSQTGATYTYQTAINGNSDVSLWWTRTGNRDSSVPVRIYSGNTLLDTVRIDQLQDGGQWNYLGTYNFAGTAKVVITHEAGSNLSTCADAAKFTP